MSDGNSLINFGDLSKPANTLIEKVSEALGGVFKPYQIRRIAKAEAEAERIKAIAKIEITELGQRALKRFVSEEAQKQLNIESILAKAIPELTEEADPQKIEKDWIINFFDKAKLISDEEMQDVWVNILAGEANAPGSFSKRTIYLLSSLDKRDAELFQKLCSFNWDIDGLVPLIFEIRDGAEIYTKHGISFDALNHLSSIGLISFSGVTGYVRRKFPKQITTIYQGSSVIIEFPGEEDNELQIGYVLLTGVGYELSKICHVERVEGFIEYVMKKWEGEGRKISQN